MKPSEHINTKTRHQNSLDSKGIGQRKRGFNDSTDSILQSQWGRIEGRDHPYLSKIKIGKPLT